MNDEICIEKKETWATVGCYSSPSMCRGNNDRLPLADMLGAKRNYLNQKMGL